MGTEPLLRLSLRSYVTWSFLVSVWLVLNKTQTLHIVDFFHEHPTPPLTAWVGDERGKMSHRRSRSSALRTL